MRHLLFAIAIAATIPAAGCSKKQAPAQQAEAKVPTVTVDELDQMLAKGDCQPVDANGKATREKMGVIPGAVLLTDSESFQPGELPADKAKPLVFYCANTSCGASHQAAGKAITAGYTNVKVLPDGIAGWVKAGKKTAPAKS
ncbi:MAG TPA: rhodanese-like domain-containing protein [Kofleriaceae bacterium]|nr:rhodanese-like domain-containing protein [Kofleriaceae bacterium]